MLFFDKKKLYITKGDANELDDIIPVSENEIVGKVISVIPFMGKIISYLLNPFFLGICFYAPLGFLFGKKVKKLFECKTLGYCKKVGPIVE